MLHFPYQPPRYSLSSARVAEIVSSRSWHETFITVLAGYIDGSNLNPDADIICVAGCAGTLDKWTVWEERWRELLSFSRLDRWHHTEFMSHGFTRNGQRHRWNEADWLVARRLLCEAFEAAQPICFGATVHRPDYDALRGANSFLPDDPYYFLLDRCLFRLVQGMAEYPVDDGVAIYCDQDKPESLVRELADWHTAYLRETAPYANGPISSARPVTTTYGSNLNYPPLQAADVVAHELMRHARRNPTLLFVPTNIESGSYILDRLKDRMPWPVSCFSKEMLEWALDGRAWVPGQWPGFRFLGPEPGGA